MSDLCDSLDDISIDSLEESRPEKKVQKVRDFQPEAVRSKIPFRLHDGIPNKSQLPMLVNREVKKSIGKENLYLTQTKMNLFHHSSILEIDDKVLSQRGLQRNFDGSFSKSPGREPVNNLPFVAVEYRNFDFRRKKPEKSRKRTQFAFDDDKKDNNSTIDVINSRVEKSTSESSNSHVVDNLTDSMKEELLKMKQISDVILKPDQKIDQKPPIQSRSECRHQTANRLLPKRNQKSNSEIKDGAVIKERSKVFTQINHLRQKTGEKKARKHKSDIILPNIIKPGLRYTERFQKECGFDPTCIRQWDKESPTDTNRSHYGDAERLSRVSSLCPILNEETDERELEEKELEEEEEEEFYMKLMKIEKKIKEGKSLKNSAGISRYRLPNGLNDKKEATSATIKSIISCRTERLTPIDLPKPSPPSSNQSGTAKSSHYCLSGNFSFSKVELATKAKIYGHKANARNLFRMKLRSRIKLLTSEESDPGLSKKLSGLNLPFASDRFLRTNDEIPDLLKGTEEKKPNSFLPSLKSKNLELLVNRQNDEFLAGKKKQNFKIDNKFKSIL